MQSEEEARATRGVLIVFTDRPAPEHGFEDYVRKQFTVEIKGDVHIEFGVLPLALEAPFRVTGQEGQVEEVGALMPHEGMDLESISSVVVHYESPGEKAQWSSFEPAIHAVLSNRETISRLWPFHPRMSAFELWSRAPCSGFVATVVVDVFVLKLAFDAIASGG